MSGGTPTQNAVLLTVVGLIVTVIVVTVVVGRLRRARSTGSAEAGSVRSRAQAKEIADRLYSFRCRFDGAPGDQDGSRPRIRVRGAARLLRVLSADDRFDVTPRSAAGECWSFVVEAPGEPTGDDEDAYRRGVENILARNGVTASAMNE